jgi:hypothetical protein
MSPRISYRDHAAEAAKPCTHCGTRQREYPNFWCGKCRRAAAKAKKARLGAPK